MDEDNLNMNIYSGESEYKIKG